MRVSAPFLRLVPVALFAVPPLGCSSHTEPPPTSPVLTPETTKDKVAKIISERGNMKPAGIPKSK